MTDFQQFVFTPAGLGDASLAIAASRAGAVGVYNAELDADAATALRGLAQLARYGRGAWGIKLAALDDAMAAGLRGQAGLGWLIVDAASAPAWTGLFDGLRSAGTQVLVEVQTPQPLPDALLSHVDGVLVKGNEAGGFVGEDASFILLQKWLQRGGPLPLYLRGGLTPHVAAACSAVGVAGGVLESQLLLLDEVRLPDTLRTLIGNLAGSETVAVGDGEHGSYFRVLLRPNLAATKAFVAEADGLAGDALQAQVRSRGTGWQDMTRGLLPIGQEVAFAAPWRKQYGQLGAVLQAVREAIAGHARLAARQPPLLEG
ncbi:MAG: beta-ketoacyl synthase, partial [Rubrivivax sp.]